MRMLPRRSPWLIWTLSAVLAAPQGLTAAAQTKAATQKTPPTPTTPQTQTPTPTASPAPTTPPATTKPAAQAKAAPVTSPPAGTNADTGWPRTITLKSGTAVWYQPQVESWTDQKNIVAWSAVSYQRTGVKEAALGTIKIEGPTQVALDDHLVTLDLRITEYNFRTLTPEQVKTLVADVQALPVHERVLDLDRLLAYVAASPLQVKNADNIKADPPRVFSSTTPAILLNLDGETVWSPIMDVDLKYVVNTNWDVLEHTPSSTLYLRYNRSWLQAKAIEGPWTPAGKLPESFSKLPADENWKEVKSAVPGDRLSTKSMPRVFVSTEPAELIAIDGPPRYVKVEGATTLLWVSNTENDLFRMGQDGDFYFLVAGRWFSSRTLDGPWTFATPTLPEDFTRIPVEHPRSRVLASVPGTPQATEGVLLAMVPRTARVNKKELKAPDVVYQGSPQFQPIQGSQNVERAVNTDKDIVKYGDLYYMCFQGVWFMSRSADGPWEVASSIPQQIYTIPASSPAHSVTYVTVEDDDDEWVTFAYVAAYTGLMIGWGCAVWGSGWYYPPYIGYGGFYPAYYPYAHTYGMGAWYNPYTGGYGRGFAAYGPYGGVGMGASYNPRTGTYARGAAAYGPYGSRAAGQAYNPRTGTYAQTRQGSNIYGNWGTSSVQRGDNWAQTAHAQNYRRGTSTSGVRTDSGAAAVSRVGPGGDRTTVGRTAGGDVYAGHDGNVYRRGESGGWQQSNGSGGWSSSTAGTQSRQLDSDRSARTQGNQRAADRSSWQSSGRTRSGASSYRGGGMRGGGRRR
jgi:hypothetical protein